MRGTHATRPRRTASAAGAFILVCAALAAGPALDADAAACPARVRAIIGLPSYQDGKGAVELIRSDHSRTILTAASLGLPGQPDDRFGESSVSIRASAGFCDGFAIGAPGTSGTGAVHVVFVTKTGLQVKSTLRGTEPGERFGQSLADRRIDLWKQDTDVTQSKDWIIAGSPGRDVNGVSDAGAITATELSAGRPVGSTMLTEESAGIVGTAEPGDAWGTSLAGVGETLRDDAPANRYAVVAVGTPLEDVGPLADAGAFTTLTDTGVGTGAYRSRLFTQNTKGVPGAAEVGDQFGRVSGPGLMIGTPLEDVGSAKDAGAVYWAAWYGSGTVSSRWHTWTQNSAGIPGVGEAGDRFGASVAFAVTPFAQEAMLYVGSPGEDLGSVRDAGSVTAIHESRSSDWDTTRTYTQGNGLNGVAEAGDQVGASVVTLWGDFSYDEDRTDDLAIGVPGEDIGGVSEAGYVVYMEHTPDEKLVPTSWKFSAGDVAGLSYGAIMSSSTDAMTG